MGKILNPKTSLKARVFLALAFLLLSSCASYRSKVAGAIGAIKRGDYGSAIATIEPLAQKQNDDQLVYLLDYATALQLAGRYQESNQAFELANDLAEVQDYTSLSREAGSLLFSERLVQYKGEAYENVFINAMAAINYLALGNTESAVVEARRMNEKLRLYRDQAKKDYQQNHFAFYLSAMSWENDRNWYSAYIDYKRTYDLNPDIPYLEEDLLRAARRARRTEDLAKYRREFSSKDAELWRRKDMGELVLIYQQGWGPTKRPHPQSFRVPKLFPVPSRTRQARLVVSNGRSETSQEIYAVSEVAIRTYNDEIGKLIAKRVAGVVAKEVVSDQIRQKNKALGDIAGLIMHVSDQADLRHWSTLPESFQIAKVYLPVGEYEIEAIGLDGAGKETSERSGKMKVQVLSRKKTFVTWRSVN